jgi:type IV pilus assembly protein PilV
LLGVAGLMFSGVSNVLASESTTKATQLAADMADRIRANPAAAVSATSEYSHNYTDSAPTSPTTTALQDVKDWIEAIKAQLPQGNGQIKAYTTGGSRKYTIEVHWAQCLGTLSKAETEGVGGCTNNPDAAFRTVLVELRI